MRHCDAPSTHNPEKRALLNCEDQWSRHATVILNPPSNEPVDTTPMFTPPATCHGGSGDIETGRGYRHARQLGVRLGVKGRTGRYERFEALDLSGL